MTPRKSTARDLMAGLLIALASLVSPCLAEAQEPSAQAVKAPIDINRAGVAELQTIKGIGPALAKRIVDHRTEQGPFAKLEDLLEVKGVGPKLLDRIRTRVVVKAPAGKKR